MGWQSLSESSAGGGGVVLRNFVLKKNKSKMVLLNFVDGFAMRFFGDVRKSFYRHDARHTACWLPGLPRFSEN